MAYEDFTTYTEFDESGDITVDSATKVSWVNLKSIQDTGYLYKDKGVNHFSADFTHKFEIQFSNVTDTAVLFNWMLANAIGDWRDLYVADEDFYAFGVYYANENLQMRIIEGGVITDDDTWLTPGPQASTTYYIEMVRDDDGGVNSTGRLTAYIRTGSHSGVLQDTLVVDCSVGKQNDYRYLYAMATDDSGSGTSSIDGFTQNLDIGEATTTSTTSTSTTTTTTISTTTITTTTAPPPEGAHLVTFLIS